MALQVWLPLTTDLRNQGLNRATISGGNYSSSGGKIGAGYYQCYSGKQLNIAETVTDTTSFSYTFWINFPSSITSVGAWQSCIGLPGKHDGTAGTMAVNWANYNQLKFYDSTGYDQKLWQSFTYDTWHHVAVVHSPNTMKIYIDGELGNRDYEMSTLISLTSGTINLGAGFNATNAKVGFQDFRLYSHALSQEEVQEISRGLVGKWQMDKCGVVEATTNRFTYPTLGSSAVNAGWDKTLHADAIYVTGWTSGYNSGVANQSTIYHAHWILMDNIPTMRFPYITNSSGQTPGWLGINTSSIPTASEFTSGVKYTVSFDAKADSDNMGITCGLYYKKASDGNNGFWDGNIGTKLTTSWKRYSVTYTCVGAYSVSAFFFYGSCSGDKGNRYVRNVQLEFKDHDTLYTQSTRTQNYIADSSGYLHNLTINGTIGQVASPRYEWGMDGNVTLTATNVGEMTSACTLSFWSKPDDPSTAQNSILQFKFGNANYFTYVNYPYFNHDTAANHYVYRYINYWADGNWHHVVCTYDGSNSPQMYIDGTAVSGLQYSTGSVSSTTTSFIAYLTKYAVSDVRLYATALSSDDVKGLYELGSGVES